MLVVGLAALLFLTLVAVFVAGRWPQVGDGEDISVSQEKVASFPKGGKEFNTSESLYIYLLRDEGSELQVRRRGRDSLLSLVSGEEEGLRLAGEVEVEEGISRFRLEAASAETLPPGAYSVVVRNASGEAVSRGTFSVRRW